MFFARARYPRGPVKKCSAHAGDQPLLQFRQLRPLLREIRNKLIQHRFKGIGPIGHTLQPLRQRFSGAGLRLSLKI